jgi:predicted 2-oxoglutarate/Fe(II)-dependent dioxygenase YbiX
MKSSDYIVKGRLTEREVRALRKDIDIYSKRSIEAGVTSKSDLGKVDKSVRNSKVLFPRITEFPRTFNTLQSAAIEYYSKVYGNIDFSNMAEIQYAKYEEGCFFKKHKDTFYNDNKDNVRLITFSINMSEEDNYAGGTLSVDDREGNTHYLDKSVGSFIMFPSMYLHEAHIVESGLREAIVTWIHGSKETLKAFEDKIKEADKPL